MPVLAVVVSISVLSCGEPQASITASGFGTLSTGEEVTLWHLENAAGASMDVTDYGCRIVRISMPDRDGRMDDVVAGYGTLDSFEDGDRFIGPVIGRYANRISGAAFILDGKEYRLDANEILDGVPVQCHGGTDGFDRFVWDGKPVEESGRVGVRFIPILPWALRPVRPWPSVPRGFAARSTVPQACRDSLCPSRRR